MLVLLLLPAVQSMVAVSVRKESSREQYLAQHLF